MVDPTVQTIQDPGRNRRIGQQIPRLDDKVVEIQPAPKRFLTLIGGKKDARETVKNKGLFGRRQGKARFAGLFNAGHPVIERIQNFGDGLLAGFRRKRPYLCPKRVLCGPTIEKDILKLRQFGQILPCQQGQPRAMFAVSHAAGEQGGNQFAQDHWFIAFEDGRVQRFVIISRGKTEPVQNLIARHIFLKCIALGGNDADQIIKVIAGIDGRHILDHGRIAAFGQPLKDLGAQLPGRVVIHFRELRGNPRFKRKATQQRCAKRVDCLDLEAARRLDGAGKQGARLPERIGMNGPIETELAQRVAQRVVGSHGPSAQTLEQAVLHLACGGLGVGETQDVLRLDPGQKQPCYTVGQNARFARSGIGRQPCGPIRTRSLNLSLCRVIPAHDRSSGLASWVASHSPNRASRS